MDKTINQGDCEPIRVQLGEFGYITQCESMILIDPKYALELSDLLATWAAASQSRDAASAFLQPLASPQ